MEEIIAKLKANRDEILAELQSDEVNKLKPAQVQELIERKFIQECILESLEREVSKKND